MRTPTVALLLLCAPVAGAAWTLQGSTEPDTPQDAQDGLAHDGSRWDAVRPKVYFNALVAQPVDPSGVVIPAAIPSSSVVGAPAVDVLPGSRLTPTHVEAHAYLGVWRDCNRDGYVGHAASALWHYPRQAALAPDATCDNAQHRFTYLGVTWIQEFVPIGYPGDTAGAGYPAFYGFILSRPAVVWDEDARVWGDFGRPGDAPGTRCPTLPAPWGTFDDTGRILGLLDCQVDRAAARTLADLDPDGAKGLAFQDPEDPRADCRNLLAQRLGLYDEDSCRDRAGLLQRGSGRPLFTAWDCSGWTADETVASGTEHEKQVRIRRIALQPGDPKGSAHDTTDGLQRGGPTGPNGGECTPDPHPGGSLVTLPRHFLETMDHSQGGPRRSNDLPMRFSYHGSPWTTPTSQTSRTTEGNPAWQLATDAPTPPGPAPRMRSDLGPERPWWTTFYARVGNAVRATTDVPHSSGAAYGAEACSVGGKGWDCQADHWWNPDWNAPPRPTYHDWGDDTSYPLGAVPGDVYHLRDVDCHDNALTTALAPTGAPPPRAGPPDLDGQGACPEKP